MRILKKALNGVVVVGILLFCLIGINSLQDE